MAMIAKPPIPPTFDGTIEDFIYAVGYAQNSYEAVVYPMNPIDLPVALNIAKDADVGYTVNGNVITIIPESEETRTNRLMKDINDYTADKMFEDEEVDKELLEQFPPTQNWSLEDRNKLNEKTKAKKSNQRTPEYKSKTTKREYQVKNRTPGKNKAKVRRRAKARKSLQRYIDKQ